MSSLSAKLSARTFTPDPTDPDSPNYDHDFTICIIARANMTQPCSRTDGSFFRHVYTDVTQPARLVACWMGHLLLAAGFTDDDLPQLPVSDFIDRITEKLNFISPCRLYSFNDNQLHAEVLAEFDRRLQRWTFAS